VLTLGSAKTADLRRNFGDTFVAYQQLKLLILNGVTKSLHLCNETGIRANFAYVGTVMSDRAKNFHPEGVRVSASRKWIGA
jgi:hypothetical protein